MFNWYDLWRDWASSFNYWVNNVWRGKGHHKQPHNRSRMNEIKRKQRARALGGKR